MLIFSSLRKGGKGVGFLHSLSKQRREPVVGRWMLTALSSILGNKKLFIQVYLCGLYLPNNYNNGRTAVEKGRPGLRGEGEKNRNLSSGEGARWSLQDPNPGWLVCLPKALANSQQGVLLGAQDGDGGQVDGRHAQTLVRTRG